MNLIKMPEAVYTKKGFMLEKPIFMIHSIKHENYAAPKRFFFAHPRHACQENVVVQQCSLCRISSCQTSLHFCSPAHMQPVSRHSLQPSPGPSGAGLSQSYPCHAQSRQTGICASRCTWRCRSDELSHSLPNCCPV